MERPENTVSLEALELDIQHYWLLIKRRWIPGAIVFGTTLILVLIGISLRKPVYTAEGKLLVDSNRPTFFSATGLELERANVNQVNPQTNPLRTETEVVLSSPLIEKTIESLELKDDKGKLLTPETLKQSIEVTNITGTDVLQVTYKGKNPREAALVVNTLMSVYLYNNIYNDQTQAKATGKFIDQQLPKSEAAVQQADVALRRFKEQNNVTDLAEAQKTALASIANLDDQITAVKTDLDTANIRVKEIQQKLRINSQQAIALSSLSQSPGVQQLLQQLQEIESQLSLERTRYKEQAPQIIDLKSKQAALRSALQQNVAQQFGSEQQLPNSRLRLGDLEQSLIQDFVTAQLERQALSSRLKLLSQTRTNTQQQANTLPRLEQQQRELERKLEASQSTYETLLKKQQEVQVAEQQNIGNARIIEPAALPKNPSNSRTLLLIVGVILAGLLTIITITILEIRDPSIKTIKQAKKVFGYTCLGKIPYIDKSIFQFAKEPDLSALVLPVRYAPHSPVSAAFRMIQTSLSFISSTNNLKMVVVTSSVAKEGKSTISANLALTMAQLGRKVLLVDADMHFPSQQRIWNLTNTLGLSDILIDMGERKETYHVAVERVSPNLDVITAGMNPSNPLVLLSSEQMTSLVQSFAKEYDFVIIDAPPLNFEPDALTLGKIADGTLLVVRPGVVDLSNAVNAKELLRRSQQNVLGTIINGSALESSYVGYQSQTFNQQNYKDA